MLRMLARAVIARMLLHMLSLMQEGKGIYKLRGEDAIIGFPGAESSVIRQRDTFMARTLRAAAQGAPQLSPASLLECRALQCSSINSICRVSRSCVLLHSSCSSSALATSGVLVLRTFQSIVLQLASRCGPANPGSNSVSKTPSVLALAGVSVSPALVLQNGKIGSDASDRQVWHYLMPDEAKDESSALQRVAPYLGGEGLYEPLQGVSRVVGVVGSAHVRGIIQDWAGADSAKGMVQLLSEE